MIYYRWQVQNSDGITLYAYETKAEAKEQAKFMTNYHKERFEVVDGEAEKK